MARNSSHSSPVISRSLFTWTVVAALAIAIGVALFLGYRAYAKKSASNAVVALAAGVTMQLNGAIEQSIKELTQRVSEKVTEGLRSGAITATETRRYAGLLDHINQQLTALEAHRKLASPELFESTHDYTSDGTHLLRRIHAHAKLRGEIFVGLGVLDDLRRQAGTRSGQWITDMVAAKKKLDTTAFEYRNGVATLDTALTGLAQSRRKFSKYILISNETPPPSAGANRSRRRW